MFSLNVGCVPSKAIIHSANLAHQVRGDVARMEEAGIFVDPSAVKVDFQKVKRGQRASFIFDAHPARSFDTELIDVASQPEERTMWGDDVYYRLKFEYSLKPDFTVLPGMSVQIEVKEGTNAS